MRRRRFTTINSRLTALLLAATFVLLLPVVAASIHFARMMELNRKLAAVEQRLKRGKTAKEQAASERELGALRARFGQIGDQAFRDVLTLAGLSLVALIAASLLVPKRLLRPLRRLSALVQQAEGGNLNVSLDSVSRDEIGDLTLRLRQVLQELNRFDQLKRIKVAALAAQRDGCLAALGAPAVLLDDEGRVARASAAFTEAFQLEAATLEQRSLLEAMGWEDTPLATELAIGEPEAARQLELRLGEAAYRVELHPIRGPEPTACYRLLILRRSGASARPQLVEPRRTAAAAVPRPPESQSK